MDGPIDPALLKNLEKFVELRNVTEANISKAHLVRAKIDQDLGQVDQDQIDDLKEMVKRVQCSLDASSTTSDQFSTVVTSFLSNLKQTAEICEKFGPSFEGLATMASMSEQVYDLERVFADYIHKMEKFRKGMAEACESDDNVDLNGTFGILTLPPEVQQKYNKQTDKISRKVLETSKRLLYFQKKLYALENGQILAETEADFTVTVDDAAAQIEHLELEVEENRTDVIKSSQPTTDIIHSYASSLATNQPRGIRTVGATELKKKVDKPAPASTSFSVLSQDDILDRILTPKRVTESKNVRISQQSPSVLQLVIQSQEAQPVPPPSLVQTSQFSATTTLQKPPASLGTPVVQKQPLTSTSFFSTPKLSTAPKEASKDESKPEAGIETPKTSLFGVVKKEQTTPASELKSEASTTSTTATTTSATSTASSTAATATPATTGATTTTTAATVGFSFATSAATGATTPTGATTTPSGAGDAATTLGAVPTSGTATTTAATSIFGAKPATTTTSIFGAKPATATTSATSGGFSFAPATTTTATAGATGFSFAPAATSATSSASGGFSFAPASNSGAMTTTASSQPTTTTTAASGTTGFSFASTTSAAKPAFSFNSQPATAATSAPSFSFNPTAATSTQGTGFGFNTASQQPKSIFGGGTSAAGTLGQPANDDGMMDDTTGQQANSLNFCSTGLGQSGPQNKTGGGFQPINFANANTAKPGFGGFNPTPKSAQPSGFGSFGQQSKPAGSGFGATPSFGSGPAFGSGSVFGGGSSVFGGKPVFGGGAQPQQGTPTNTGFSAFAGKATSFGQLAQSPQQSSSLFGGGAQAQQQSTGFGSFGSSNTTNTNPAFTAFRK
ncbi:unnamed protein product [Bursaphelenchus okinawaensis]|uniref:Uncharacterized protein n=1 Tax=Bursaphelenchus okinawaensis TaxID=465554 RepID=A0A811KBG0_9BILA|nr:unnamed protein product [Bursaphelenchus okinawaensis]CAG9097737.1 unnamed protein product [Bursaphelenchus okinawaensis]